MAVNLRLSARAAAALRAESQRTGLSQQEILRRAVDEHLGIVSRTRAPDWVMPASERPKYVEPVLRLPASVDVIDLVDRGDRV